MCQKPNSRLEASTACHVGNQSDSRASPTPRKANSSNSTVPSGTLTRVLYSRVRGPRTARSSARNRRVKVIDPPITYTAVTAPMHPADQTRPRTQLLGPSPMSVSVTPAR